ncbi:conjugative transposon protein TraM [Sphingobacterium sp. BIGb0116]|uniref:conjugative transposon protein TraM n=1 Tax=Sphingobacterium sp. BIGb0116 TaxID=2940619 RepID=UPI0021685B18|nr:conjugative transposon protein TraM [Sphingobacterium sp. BIGb0116]MCS4165205.1 conjugative transposon TraM protein [Sphingobacterium sp. BIGb0116]
MEQQPLNEQQQKQRKFFLFLPLICIPFLTLMFWLMGGGKSETAMAKADGGLNLNLPEANNKETEFNKLDFYNQAEKDSLKLKELMKADPNYTRGVDSDFMASQDLYGLTPTGLNTSVYSSNSGGTANQESRIYNRLNQLQTELNRNYVTPQETYYSTPYRNYAAPSVNTEEVERLEKMMESMSGTAEEDKEVTELSSMMDKILDIQHPDRVQKRLKEQSEQHHGQVYSFKSAPKSASITVLDNRPVKQYAEDYNTNGDKPLNSFYGLDNNATSNQDLNAIAALVHETQTLVSGSTIKLRLSNDAFINGVLIPKGSFIYGQVSLRGERLEVDIDGVQYKESLFPVKLSVFDLDGIAGIRIPGAITRDVIKQNSDQTIQSMSLGTFDQSLGAQAASAGIELGKNLLSKKVKQIKVEVKAGYRILLKDNKRKDQ